MASVIGGKWTVDAEPHSEYDEKGKNIGGLRVLVVNTELNLKKEISRVAFDRRVGDLTKTTFEDAIAAELKKAATSADTMNKLLAEADAGNNPEAFLV